MLTEVKNIYWKERGEVLMLTQHLLSVITCFRTSFLLFFIWKKEQTCMIFVLEMIGDDVESEFS